MPLLLALLLAASSPFRVGTTSIVCIGDSITFGYAVGDSYPAVLGRSVAAVHPVLNMGMTGDYTNGMASRWLNSLKPDADIRYVVIIGGVNDVINGVTGATAFANLKTIYDDVRTRGLVLVVVTALPFKTYSLWTSAKQTELDSLNTSIRSYASTNSITLIDGYALFGDTDPQALKAAYNSGDGLHPNQTGANLLASQVKTALGL